MKNFNIVINITIITTIIQMYRLNVINTNLIPMNINTRRNMLNSNSGSCFSEDQLEWR